MLCPGWGAVKLPLCMQLELASFWGHCLGTPAPSLGMGIGGSGVTPSRDREAHAGAHMPQYNNILY